MHFPVNCHTVGENFSPRGLTSCPDDHPLAVVQVPCSSSCLQPVTQVKSRKLQAMPLVCSDHTHCNKYIKSEVSPVVGLTGPSFQFPFIKFALFSCMQFVTLHMPACTMVLNKIKDFNAMNSVHFCSITFISNQMHFTI
jgi:hypothetical protein